VNRVQQLVLLSVLLIVGTQLVAVGAPAGDGGCSAAVVDAFGEPRRSRLPAGSSASSDRSPYRGWTPPSPFSIARGVDCQQPARHQVWRAVLISGLAALGLVVALRILADPHDRRPSQIE